VSAVLAFAAAALLLGYGYARSKRMRLSAAVLEG